jgi:hypothetical protein
LLQHHDGPELKFSSSAYFLYVPVRFRNEFKWLDAGINVKKSYGMHIGLGCINAGVNIIILGRFNLTRINAIRFLAIFFVWLCRIRFPLTLLSVLLVVLPVQSVEKLASEDVIPQRVANKCILYCFSV